MSKLVAKVIEAAAREGELYIYGPIGDYWDGVSAKDFSAALKGLGEIDRLNLHLNSPGGDVFDGVAIFNELKNFSARVWVHVDGLAASAASVIAMAGNRIVMGEGSFLMIHNAWGVAVGDNRVMAQMAETLEKINGELADIYGRRSGRERGEILAAMDAETWLTADEAVAMGLADKAVKTAPPVEPTAAAMPERLIAAYKKMPAELRARAQQPPLKTANTAAQEEPEESPASPGGPGANRVARQRLAELSHKLTLGGTR